MINNTLKATIAPKLFLNKRVKEKNMEIIIAIFPIELIRNKQRFAPKYTEYAFTKIKSLKR
ncbi:hypothetical protein FACS1894180_9450 [Bacteroidia bacterium]|nr:hypothetical protein FACS1894180_9450 [Bacteroidia bacterium]